MRVLFLLLAFISNRVWAQDKLLPLIPYPQDLQLKQGCFVFDANVALIDAKELEKEANYLTDYLKNAYHYKFTTQTGTSKLVLELDKNSPEENYSLNITSSEIKISGGRAGVFYGIQTLFQLLPPNFMDVANLPCLSILDSPRYAWRGMHLDVCRHFFPKDFIKKYIDLLAMYKMNTFHWHLTEDQGWRIEIKKYPRLTQTGAWRNGSMIGRYRDHNVDSIRYGGFYTQEDIKEIVAYATERHIAIVPEIEMPGHSVAAISAYPFLSCEGKQMEVAKEWGVFEDVYCAKEETFKFLEDVLSEVVNLFPGKYIHIGGDECPKERWKSCSNCQALIKKEGLIDEHQLQSYFITRMEKFLNSKGKQIIGWDEILEGGLAPNAAVMSWRGTEGGIAAAKQKHNVIMSPGSHCYFDHYQSDPSHEPIAIGGYTTVEKVYSYEPTPKELSEEEKKYIMGAQANVWTEYILSPSQAEYMAVPRMTALAEVLWINPQKKDFNDFISRLEKHFSLLDKKKINYSRSIYDIACSTRRNASSTGLELELKSQAKGKIIMNFNGVDSEYKQPYLPENSGKYSFQLLTNSGKKGNVETAELLINKASGRKLNFMNEPNEYYFKNEGFGIVNGLIDARNGSYSNCVGYNGCDGEIVISLDKITEVSQMDFYVIRDEQNDVFMPADIQCAFSSDGKIYNTIPASGKIVTQVTGYVKKVSITFPLTSASFVRINLINSKESLKQNNGKKDNWILLDEIVVQ